MSIQIGHRVGRLTVAEPTGERRSGYTVWRCKCDCGGEILLDTRYLQRETIKDCGCRSKVKPGQKDLTGMRFGRLVAIEPTEKRAQSGGTIWKCRCDCGKEAMAVSTQLTQGYKKSCGCWGHPDLKDYVGRRFGNLTVVEYAGKRAGMHRWKCRCDCGNEAVVGQTNLQSGKTKSCGCLQGTVIRETLQLIDGTSVRLLKSNRNTLMSSNTSGCTGVYQNRKGKWIAQITLKGKTYYLGSYTEKDEAIRARKRGEEMHDEFLRWYYLEHMGLEQLPEEIQRMIENESNEDDAGSKLATADVD